MAWAAAFESWEDAPETPPLQRSRSCSPASLEEGIEVLCETEDYVPNEATEPKSSNARYIRGNLAILLATCLLILPLLTWILVPSLFIITGQRQYIEAYFYLVHGIATLFAESAFYTFLRLESLNEGRATFREALCAAVGKIAASLGALIVLSLLARVVWPILRIVWILLSAIWGGMPVFKGEGWSLWDEIDRVG